MKVVYIAGPFRSPTHWGIEQNIRAAETWGFEVAKVGAMPMIPHANTRFFHGTLTDDFWLDGTLEMLRRCDAIFLIPGWETSAGSRGERHEAERLGMPVLSTREELEAWVRSGSALRGVGANPGRSEVDAARERRELGGSVVVRHGAKPGPGVSVDIGLDDP